MLRLRRKPGESVVIGDNIKVTNHGKHAVYIGVEAPKSVRIVREELLKAIAEGSPAPGTGEVLRHEDATGRKPSR